jgi:hypothetical protein
MNDREEREKRWEREREPDIYIKGNDGNCAVIFGQDDNGRSEVYISDRRW